MTYSGRSGSMLTLIAVLALLAVALMGCPPEEQTATDDGMVVPPPEPDVDMEPAPVDDEAHANVVEVTLVDGEIQMPDTLSAGSTTFEITNAGELPHNFEIEGQGMEEVLENDLQPGESGTLNVDLQPGSYEVYCPVGDHAEQGMRMTLTVTE